MANTYSCLHVQLVFAVYRRENLIPENRRIAIQKYMTAVAQAHEIKVLAIYCNPDHVHILVGVKPDMSVS
ncbi:MAG: transposase, partial [Bacteroidota bacterium]